jgi:hypothetical protein
MFDEIDNLPQFKEKASDKSGNHVDNDKRSINLLPGNLKMSKKALEKEKKLKNLSKKEMHQAAKKEKYKSLVDSPKPKKEKKPKGSFLKKLFGFKKKKKPVQPNIIAMNAVEKNKTNHDAKTSLPATPKPSGEAPSKPAPLPVAKPLDPQPQPKKAEVKSKPHKNLHSDDILFSDVKPEKEDPAEEDEMEVNLLPKRKQLLSDKQMIVSYALIVIISFLVVISPFVYYKSENKGYEETNLDLQTDIEKIQKKNNELKRQIDELGPLSKKMKVLLPILDNHIYWSEFYPVLELYTAKNVYFVSLDSDTKENKVSLSAKALNLRDVAEQLVILHENPDITNIRLESLSFVETDIPEDTKLDFSLTYTINPNIIRQSEE